MSYSFQVKAATKELALAAVGVKFDEIVSQQPIHAKDREAVVVNAGAVINLLTDNNAKDVVVSCNGYLSWNGSPDEAEFIAAAVSCSAGHAIRE